MGITIDNHWFSEKFFARSVIEWQRLRSQEWRLTKLPSAWPTTIEESLLWVIVDG
jgi:hypothetical protein